VRGITVAEPSIVMFPAKLSPAAGLVAPLQALSKAASAKAAGTYGFRREITMGWFLSECVTLCVKARPLRGFEF
jgi:hypothetical protein